MKQKKIKTAKTKARVKSTQLKKSGVVRKKAHSSARTKRTQGKKDNK